MMKEGRIVPRKGFIAKREVLPDPVYNSKVITKLINQIMLDGKKGTAQKILYKSLEIVGEKTSKDPLEVLNQAFENIKPAIEIKSRRVGGSNYSVPMEVREDRANALMLRWLIQYAKNRSGRGMAEKLAAEIIDASNGTGGAVKKREDTHKMAEANKAYAHYRW